MLGMADLKQTIEITETTVECPVKGCNKRVARQRKRFVRRPSFRCCGHGCTDHDIYISPSTFEYADELQNLLSKDPEDLKLLARVKTVKREKHRFARDNSEDALTWNVFRFLEKERLLGGLLSAKCGSGVTRPQAIYWSYSEAQDGPWEELLRARVEFGEARGIRGAVRRGSEPDLIVLSERDLFFIESKLTATNNTTPYNPNVRDGYMSGGAGWWDTVFGSDFDSVAIAEKKYELARFWLIGTWLAEKMGAGFCLISLVPSWQSDRPERAFAGHIRQGRDRRFVRMTWEDIFHYVSATDLVGTSKASLLAYFRNKTMGYDRRGNLQRAFHLS
jgi:hypothetical protein